MKEQEIVSKVGYVLKSYGYIRVLKLDIVQVPFNMFDQQILSSGWSDKLKNIGVKFTQDQYFCRAYY